MEVLISLSNLLAELWGPRHRAGLAHVVVGRGWERCRSQGCWRVEVVQVGEGGPSKPLRHAACSDLGAGHRRKRLDPWPQPRLWTWPRALVTSVISLRLPHPTCVADSTCLYNVPSPCNVSVSCFLLNVTLAPSSRSHPCLQS